MDEFTINLILLMLVCFGGGVALGLEIQARKIDKMCGFNVGDKSQNEVKLHPWDN